MTPASCWVDLTLEIQSEQTTSTEALVLGFPDGSSTTGLWLGPLAKLKVGTSPRGQHLIPCVRDVAYRLFTPDRKPCGSPEQANQRADNPEEENDAEFDNDPSIGPTNSKEW